MAAECRAKDPSSCRVHGSSSGADQNLNHVANKAAKSRDLNAYLSARSEMDSKNIASEDNEDVVRRVLGKTYNQFGFNRTEALIADFVYVLEDPSQAVVEDAGDPSPAAEHIRSRLWSRYSGGGASASATSDLFYTLGRQDELGWIEEQVPGYRYYPEDFA